MAVKLLRTIRLDPSDSFVFDPPANSGEWAVSGGFMFWDIDPRALTGRPKQAFRSGFLGLTSFGWSTLAIVTEATAEEREGAVESLAQHLLAVHGAPSIEAARAAAEEEIAYTQTLALHPVQSLIALHRTVTVDGSVSEQFRILQTAEARKASAMPCSAGAFAIIDVEDGAMAGSGEEIDLASLAETVRSRSPDR